MRTRSGNWYIIDYKNNTCNQHFYKQYENNKSDLHAIYLAELVNQYQNEYVYNIWKKNT